MMKNDLQEAKTDMAHEDCFRFSTETKILSQTVKNLIELYNEMYECFNKCVDYYIIFLYCYDYTNVKKSPCMQQEYQQPNTNKSKNMMQDEVLNWYHWQIWGQLKNTRDYLMKHGSYINIEYHLSALFPFKNSNAVTIDLDMLFSKTQFTKIPVNLHNITHWNSLMMSLIDYGGLTRSGVVVHYKTWLNNGQMVFVYKQICLWIINYLQSLEKDLKL